MSTVEANLCACGCGEQVTAGRRWRQGHQNRVTDFGFFTSTLAQCVEEDRGHRIDGRSSHCWIWQGGTDRHGHSLIHRTTRHRHIYALLHPDEDLTGQEIHHVCEVKRCLNPQHLRSLSRTAHRRSHAKITAVDVAEIRSRCAAGEVQRVVAADYGLSQNTVSQIVNHVRWAEA